MPSWKKLLVSGSDASLNSLTVNGAITADTISGSFSGSYVGDGSGLTNVNANVAEVATISDTFTSTTSKTVNHLFGTKDVIVTVYNDSDQQIIPATVTTTDINNVTVTFDNNTTGRVVVAKGGHLVSGSIVNVSEVATVEDTFTGVTSKTTAHTFGTKNVFVTVYNDSDDQIIPARINTTNTGSVTVEFDTPTTGRIVIGKAGHIVTGSSAAQWNSILNKPNGIISGSDQLTGSFDTRYALSGSTGVSDFTQLTNIPSGLVSGSTQVDYTLISNIPSGIVSGSSQVDYSGLQNIPSGLVSSSAQVDYTSLQNIPSGIVSGSAQVEFNSVNNNPFISSSTAVTASAHLVPGLNETYDLGSANLRWRDLYLSGSTVYLGETKITRTEQGDVEFRDSQTDSLRRIRVDELEIGSGASARKIQVDNTGRIKFATTGDEDKTIEALGFQGIVTSSAQLSFDEIPGIPSGLVSSSVQVDLTQTTNFINGIKGRLNVENVPTSSTQIVDFLNGTSLVLSNLTINGTQTTVNSTQLDIGDSIISLNGTGSVLGGIHVNDGPVSGSILWHGTNNQWIAGPSGSEAKILLATGDNIVSGSSQISFNGITDKPTLVSGSSQISYSGLSNIPSGIVSGSSQISLSGFSTTNLSEGTNLYYTDSRVKTKLNTENVVSGSNILFTSGNTLKVTGTGVDPNASDASYFWNQAGSGPTISGLKFEVRTGGGGAQSQALLIDNSQNATFAGTVTATSLTETSALRFKVNIQEDLDSSIIDKLRPVSYDWKETKERDFGFIAEEVDKLDSTLTTRDDNNELLGIKYTKLIPLLVKKIQEQEERIRQLENGNS